MDPFDSCMETLVITGLAILAVLSTVILLIATDIIRIP